MAEVLRGAQRNQVENCPGFLEAFNDLSNHPDGEWRGCIYGCGVRVMRRKIGATTTIDSIVKEGGDPRCKETRINHEEAQKERDRVNKKNNFGDTNGCENPACKVLGHCAETHILTQSIDLSKTDFYTLRGYFLALMASINQAIIYNCPNLPKLDQKKAEITIENGSCPSFSRATKMSKLLGHSVFTCKGGGQKCGVEAIRTEHGTVTIDAAPDSTPCAFSFLAKVKERGGYSACGFDNCATENECIGYRLTKERIKSRNNAAYAPETLQNICEGIADSATNARCVNPGAIRNIYKEL